MGNLGNPANVDITRAVNVDPVLTILDSEFMLCGRVRVESGRVIAISVFSFFAAWLDVAVVAES